MDQENMTHTDNWPDGIANGPELPPGMVRPVQLMIAAERLDEIRQQGRPADRVLQRHFREHHGLGRKDRARIQSLVYFVLRHWRLLDWLSNNDGAALPDERRRVATALRLADRLDAVLAEKGGVDATTIASIDESRQTPWSTIPPAIRHSLADHDMAGLERAFGDLADKVASAINRQAPVMLRVNPLKSDRDHVQANLSAEGITTETVANLPLALRVDGSPALTRTAAWRRGAFEIQDAGSQRIVAACAARPGQRILDLCAGAGGKTLGLAAELRDQGEILACDVVDKRLARLLPRAKRAGLHCIETRTIRNSHDPALTARGPFDCVLIDAPCSGSGTWRRHPELKQSEAPLPELMDTQRTLLEDGVRLTRPGGRLVYATCSLWCEENEDQIDRFLDNHPDWRLLPQPEAKSGLVRLRPDRDASDGFFFAVLQAPEPA